ncbi:hypothetical protein K227x_47250 [Rubripirellula lacrimiformis]|uniref:Uncharacterized protein n=1 Tax=Rubripirellula lacrimiformis TaxID=1930273 RepID=A0A517NGQ3_9BACT|nr:hypothetical protein [Rubripirellula lacrimiformis]QDT06316.1 hypothetical protein K227x_47250 [Rubripirellula lacrimiformis]
MNALVNRELLLKELRESLRWTPLGMLLVVVLAWQSIPSYFDSYQYPALPTSMMGLTSIGFSVIAIALAWLQTIPDMRPDARGFLLHRPVRLSAIFGTKLIAGWITYAVAVLPPLALIAWRLSIIGPTRAPTNGGAVIPSLIAVAVVFVLHPAAMWAAFRTARWVGTRTMPLIFAGGGIALALGLLASIDSVGMLFFFLAVVVLVFFVTVTGAWQCFRDQTFLPSLSSGKTTSAARAFGLLVGSIALVVTAGVLLVTSTFASQYDDWKRYYLTMDDHGSLWEVMETPAQTGAYAGGTKRLQARLRSVDLDSGIGEFSHLSDGWKSARRTSIGEHGKRGWFAPFHHWGSVSTVIDEVPYYYQMVSYEGALLLYDHRGLESVITPDGILATSDQPESRFDDLMVINSVSVSVNANIQLQGQTLLYDDRGVYQLDLESRTLRKIIDSQGGTFVLSLPAGGPLTGSTAAEENEASLWNLHDNQLTHYRLKTLEGDDLPAPQLVANVSSQYHLPAIVATRGQVYPCSSEGPRWLSMGVFEWADGQVSTIQSLSSSLHRVTRYGDAGKPESEHLVPIAISSSSSHVGKEIHCLPPVVLASIAATIKISQAQPHVAGFDSTTAGFPYAIILSISLQSIIAVAFVIWMSARLGLSTRHRIVWVVLASLFGLGTMLAIVAIHQRPVWETCSDCQSPRRIDEERCRHCDAAWERLPVEGIELIGPSVARDAAIAGGGG